jgi:hypothetical protein
MHLSIRKTISNKPWIPIVVGFLLFAAGWSAFVVYAVKNQPREVERATKPPSASQP